MKALSIHPAYAMAIAGGNKSVECRSWKTDYRGDILICSTAKKQKGTIPSHAIAVVRLIDIVPFQKKHLKDACMTQSQYQEGMYAWILTYNRLIKPIPIKGKLGLWDYDGEIEFIPEDEYLAGAYETPEETERLGELFVDKYWADILT